MKPLLINTSDQGGAAKACIRLHQGLLNSGIESQLMVSKKIGNNINTCFEYSEERRLPFKQHWAEKTKRILNEFRLYNYYPKPYNEKQRQFLESRPKSLDFFSFPYSNYDLQKSMYYQQCDLVHLHWIANYLDYPTFFKQNTKPLVWTLHDQNPFLGGEHFSETIIGMDKSGYPVIRTLTQETIDEQKRILEVKQNAYRHIKELTIVTPSKWLENEARGSELLATFKIKNIPYGINTSVFNIRDKQFSKSIIGVEKDAKVLLFVADYTDNARKGFAFLQKAFDLIDEKVILLVLGKGKIENQHHLKVKNLGFIHDELLMSIIYSAADFFIIPSLMDNLPNTVIESLCCGTPVIGFRVGGIPDMVQHGTNGMLCNEISAPALASVINNGLAALNNFDNISISNDARIKYDEIIQTTAYLSLYKRILDKSELI